MRKWWRKFRTWEEQRRRKYLLERWAGIRAKGKTHFVIRAALVRSLILSICMGLGRWYSEFGLSPRALVSSDLILYWFFALAFLFLVFFLFVVDGEWNANEKKYQQLMDGRL